MAKFPPDFCFRLTRSEAEEVRRSRSQVVILKRGHVMKFRPFAFTERGRGEIQRQQREP